MNKKLIVKTGRNVYHRILWSDLEYIQASKGRTILICKETLNTSTSFNDVLSALDGKLFQCHRSYAVNLDLVKSFTHDSITLINKTLPLGGKYKNAFLECMFERDIFVTSSLDKSSKTE